jgi:hypothetical protein
MRTMRFRTEGGSAFDILPDRSKPIREKQYDEDDQDHADDTDAAVTEAIAVAASLTMPMEGAPEMVGSVRVRPTDTVGVHEVTADLLMQGLWHFTVEFGAGQQARFHLKVESSGT